MDFGACIFPTADAMHPAELARALEERGFESYWVAEHTHIPASRRSPWPGGADLPQMYYETMDPFVALTAAATATENLKVGTGICLVVERDPITTAKEVASIDRVSNGRFLFGVGGALWIRASCHGAACSGVLWRSLGAQTSARCRYGGVFPTAQPAVRPRRAG